MRQAIFSDADKCQPAEFVANIVKEIIIDNKYKNGDSIVIKNSTVNLETLAKY